MYLSAVASDKIDRLCVKKLVKLFDKCIATAVKLAEPIEIVLNCEARLVCACLGVVKSPTLRREIASEHALAVLGAHKSAFFIEEVAVGFCTSVVFRGYIVFAENCRYLCDTPVTVSGVKREVDALVIIARHVSEPYVILASRSAEYVVFRGNVRVLEHSLKYDLKLLACVNSSLCSVCKHGIYHSRGHTAFCIGRRPSREPSVVFVVADKALENS